MSEFLRFRGSSKFFLIIFMPIIFLYFLGHIIKMIMTDSETKVSTYKLLINPLENCKCSRQTARIHEDYRDRPFFYVPDLFHLHWDDCFPWIHGHLQHCPSMPDLPAVPRSYASGKHGGSKDGQTVLQTGLQDCKRVAVHPRVLLNLHFWFHVRYLRRPARFPWVRTPWCKFIQPELCSYTLNE